MPPPSRNPARRRAERRSIVIVAGMLLFAAAFIGLATWLGKQNRHHYRQPEALAGSAEEAEVSERLKILDAASALGPIGKAEASTEPLATRLARTKGPEARADRALGALLEGDPIAAAHVLTAPLTTPRERFLAAIALRSAHAPEMEQESAWRAVLVDRAQAADALVELANAHLKRKTPKDALDWAERAVRSAPSWPETHRVLGRVCFELQDIGRAKQAYRNVLQFLPEDSEAKRTIQRIDGL